MSTRPTHAEISREAYRLWEEAGKPEGQDWEFWFVGEWNCLHSWHRHPRNARESQRRFFLSL